MEEDEVITNFTDSESDDNDNDNIKSCCQETNLMMDVVKQEAVKQKSAAPFVKKVVTRSDRYDLKVNPDTRKILAKKGCFRRYVFKLLSKTAIFCTSLFESTLEIISKHPVKIILLFHILTF